MKKIFAALADRINPVMLKEIRQSFHNRLFLSLTAGLLGVQFIVLLFFMMLRKEWENGSDGGKILLSIDSVLMYLCIFAVSAYGAMERFTTERSSEDLDFSLLTLLTPWQIVMGKLGSSLVSGVLIVSLCLPFMTVAYFFRNVTLQEIAKIFLTGMIPAITVIQAALFCGSLGKKCGHPLFIVFCFQAVFPLCIALTVVNSPANIIFWLLQVGTLLLWAILFAATTAVITPPFANRMLPVRLLLFIAALVVFGFIPFMSKQPQDAGVFFSAIPLGIYAVLGLLVLCDREIPGARVMAEIPKNPVGRIFHFLLSSNRTGGMAGLFLLLLLFAGVMFSTHLCGIRKSLVMIAFSFCCYGVFYTGIALWINRLIPKVPGVVVLILTAVILGLLPALWTTGGAISSEDVFFSPLWIMESSGIPLINDREFWFPLLLAAVPGVYFLAEGAVKLRKYRPPVK